MYGGASYSPGTASSGSKKDTLLSHFDTSTYPSKTSVGSKKDTLLSTFMLVLTLG